MANTMGKLEVPIETGKREKSKSGSSKDPVLRSPRGFEYRIGNVVGTGVYGTVVAAKASGGAIPRNVVLKVAHVGDGFARSGSSEASVQLLLQGGAFSSGTPGPALRLLDAFSWGGRPCLVSPRWDFSLFEAIRQTNFRGLKPSHILPLARTLLTALAELHARRVVHADVKPENVLVRLSDDGEGSLDACLADFGSAWALKGAKAPGVMRGVGNLYAQSRFYRAPEVLSRDRGSYGPSMDVWSLGCVLFEARLGLPLFPGNDEADQLERIRACVGRGVQDESELVGEGIVVDEEDEGVEGEEEDDGGWNREAQNLRAATLLAFSRLHGGGDATTKGFTLSAWEDATSPRSVSGKTWSRLESLSVAKSRGGVGRLVAVPGVDSGDHIRVAVNEMRPSEEGIEVDVSKHAQDAKSKEEEYFEGDSDGSDDSEDSQGPAETSGGAARRLYPSKSVLLLVLSQRDVDEGESGAFEAYADPFVAYERVVAMEEELGEVLGEGGDVGAVSMGAMCTAEALLFTDMVLGALNPDPVQRQTAPTLSQHPWFILAGTLSASSSSVSFSGMAADDSKKETTTSSSDATTSKKDAAVSFSGKTDDSKKDDPVSFSGKTDDSKKETTSSSTPSSKQQHTITVPPSRTWESAMELESTTSSTRSESAAAWGESSRAGAANTSLRAALAHALQLAGPARATLAAISVDPVARNEARAFYLAARRAQEKESHEDEEEEEDDAKSCDAVVQEADISSGGGGGGVPQLPQNISSGGGVPQLPQNISSGGGAQLPQPQPPQTISCAAAPDKVPLAPPRPPASNPLWCRMGHSSLPKSGSMDALCDQDRSGSMSSSQADCSSNPGRRHLEDLMTKLERATGSELEVEGNQTEKPSDDTSSSSSSSSPSKTSKTTKKEQKARRRPQRKSLRTIWRASFGGSAVAREAERARSLGVPADALFVLASRVPRHRAESMPWTTCSLPTPTTSLPLLPRSPMGPVIGAAYAYASSKDRFPGATTTTTKSTTTTKPTTKTTTTTTTTTSSTQTSKEPRPLVHDATSPLADALSSENSSIATDDSFHDRNPAAAAMVSDMHRQRLLHSHHSRALQSHLMAMNDTHDTDVDEASSSSSLAHSPSRHPHLDDALVHAASSSQTNEPSHIHIQPPLRTDPAVFPSLPSTLHPSAWVGYGWRNSGALRSHRRWARTGISTPSSSSSSSHSHHHHHHRVASTPPPTPVAQSTEDVIAPISAVPRVRSGGALWNSFPVS